MTYRPSRTCLYLCTSDIWICWFGRFAFVKPSRQVISTLPLERRWISPKKIHGFSKSNHLHLQSGDLSTFVRVCCFLHCSSIGIHLSNPFSLSPSYSVMNGDGKKYLVMDNGMEHRRISPKKKLYLPTPIIYPINYLAFSLLCVMKCCMAPKKDSNFVSSLGASTEISVYRDLGTQIDTLGKGSQKKGEK